MKQQQQQEQLLMAGQVYDNFVDSIKSPRGRKVYVTILKIYMIFRKVNTPKELLKDNPKIIQSDIICYLTSPHIRSLAHSTRLLYSSTLRHFYDMNDIVLNWKKINKYLGEDERALVDRAYTKEEIAKMLESADERTRVVILLMASAALRIGALPGLKLRHLLRIEEYGLYRITVYEKSKSQYFSFCTPECAKAIDNYLEYRQRYNERLTPESPLFREQFDKNDELHRGHARPISLETFYNLLNARLQAAGIRNREPLQEGENKRKRKDVMISHGFRKFVNTTMIRADLKPINKERLLGHRTGLEDCYYRPEESEIMQDYLKAVNLLTISEENRLKSQVTELKERTKTNEYIITGKLQEKDKQIEILMKKQEQFEEMLQSLIDSGQLKPTAN